MTFEIRRMEGLARHGIVNLTQEVETPTFVDLQYNPIKEEDFISENQYFPKKSKNFQDFLLSNDLSDLSKKYDNKEELSILINLYPSLQTQGKSLSQINSLSDLFPESTNLNESNCNSFHQIPWDQTSIYLDKKDVYLKALKALNEDKRNKNANFMLNIPFSNKNHEIKEFPFPSGVKIVCLGDISSLLNHSTSLIDYLSILQAWVPPSTMFYAPGVPSIYFPILTYMGIDLYDFSYLLTPGKLNSSGSQVILENHKYKEEYVNTLKLVKEAIKNHKLRDLVRIYANSYPPLKSLLRQIDRNLPCNQGTPLFGVKTLYCTDHTDFSRPEVNRFRKRVKETFLIKPYVQGILFLPCSAKKPYSQSKSHQFFLSTIRRTIKGRRSYLQEIILTSPLGIVPRELEYTFPAAHYDIPVTGDWSKLEQDILYQDVKNLLEKINDSITIIGFVKGVERNVLERISEDSGREIHLPNPEIDSLLSRDGKNALFRLLSKNCLFSSSIKINSNLEFIRTIADYQFGKGAGKLIFPSNTQIVGRKELGFRIRLNKEHLSSFRPSSGFLTLSIEAAKRIQHHSKRKVIFDGKKIVGSTIFTNAIQHADLDIRINDEVFVENDQGKIIATGTSYLPGKLLTDMNRGYGVKIRQKVRGE